MYKMRMDGVNERTNKQTNKYQSISECVLRIYIRFAYSIIAISI